MWYRQYIGLPWLPYTTGPDSFDCWGIVYRALKDHYQIVDLPRFLDVGTKDAVAIHKTAHIEAEQGEWIKLDAPQEGAVILMGRKQLLHHIGIYVDGGVLHSRRGVGVCREPLSRLPDYGLKNFEYWIHRKLYDKSKRTIDSS